MCAKNEERERVKERDEERERGMNTNRVGVKVRGGDGGRIPRIATVL